MTFHGPARYADQQLTMAVRILAVGAGDVRSRLLDAYGQFHPLTPAHFPEHLRTDFEWILSQLNKYEPFKDAHGKVLRGSVQQTLMSIRSKTGVKIAERLLYVHEALEKYVRTHNES